MDSTADAEAISSVTVAPLIDGVPVSVAVPSVPLRVRFNENAVLAGTEPESSGSSKRIVTVPRPTEALTADGAVVSDRLPSTLWPPRLPVAEKLTLASFPSPSWISSSESSCRSSAEMLMPLVSRSADNTSYSNTSSVDPEPLS